MKKTLLLLAGYPGTGKSYLAKMIMDQFSEFVLCSPDEIKEAYWDKYGFKTLDEKEFLISKSWDTYYHQLGKYFKEQHSVISDYPFSDKQKDKLKIIALANNVQIITIRLTGDIKVLFDRSTNRDLDSTRHLGHILLEYYKGINISHEDADNLLDYEEFYKRCTTRGYGEFTLGETIEVDVSDFSLVDYPGLLKRINEIVKDC